MLGFCRIHLPWHYIQPEAKKVISQNYTSTSNLNPNKHFKQASIGISREKQVNCVLK